ncbi:FAD-dependent oxidoreductase [Limnochorda pilosa]|uniref:Glucose-inhibited division protein A n=1 Tax=Limnochorda pilosa TaxID=1555112 RepID=A0A0K2SJS6_LIMPI|nr:FAD-dependent oxidoreductase [Limnochorda pilosa]BAS27368.1 glucose-inhibited division protein A [Limnochorda pilosa]
MVPVHTYDLVVVGGGNSGVLAAVAAARMGLKVALVERYGFLGGTLTAAMVGPIQSFHAGETQVVRGLPQEVVDRLQAIGGSPGHVPDPIDYCSSITPFDFEALKRVFQEMCVEAGVDLWLHATFLDAAVDGRQLRHVRVWQKDGVSELAARFFVDASGDGDLSAAAGVPFRVGRDEDSLPQPMTMIFSVGGVDWDRAFDFFREHPEELQHPVAIHGTIDPDRLRSLPFRGFSAFPTLLAEAREEGAFTIPRQRLLVFESLRKGEAVVNTTRVQGLSSLNGRDLARAEVEGRRQVWELVDFLRDRVPGFEEVHVIAVAPQIGVRESRRIEGEVQVTQEDVLAARTFPDAIACGAYPIDIHDPASTKNKTRRLPEGEYYTVPYRAMVPRAMDNLLVTGRCISATHEALAALRLSPFTMAMGHAAGVAATLALRKGAAARDVDTDLLRGTLVEQGAFVGGGA